MAKSFKEFEIVKNFSHKDKGKILSYIELVYNKSSELQKTLDFHKRQLEALQQVGLKPENFQDLLQLKTDKYQDLVFQYLAYFLNSNEHMMFMNNQNLLWDIQREMLRPVENEEDKEDLYDLKLKWSSKCEELNRRIKVQRAELYPVEQVGTEANDMIDNKIRILRAEERITSKSV